MKEKENFRLNLRKNKINSILSFKRQIDFSSNSNDNNEKYHIFLQDIQLNSSLFINEDKFYSNVIILK